MQIAVERQDLSRIYLAHHQLDSEMIVVIITIIIIIIIIIIKYYHYCCHYEYC